MGHPPSGLIPVGCHHVCSATGEFTLFSTSQINIKQGTVGTTWLVKFSSSLRDGMQKKTLLQQQMVNGDNAAWLVFKLRHVLWWSSSDASASHVDYLLLSPRVTMSQLATTAAKGIMSWLFFLFFVVAPVGSSQPQQEYMLLKPKLRQPELHLWGFGLVAITNL